MDIVVGMRWGCGCRRLILGYRLGWCGVFLLIVWVGIRWYVADSG